jgi:hypothetical protein
MQNWRDLIRARMMRVGGGASRGISAPSRRPSSGGRDIEMQARNSRLGSAPSSSGRRPVPGLPGVFFADDYGQAMQTAAESTRLWNSPDRMKHPAIDFSRQAAGIDGGSTGAVQQITDDVHGRLAEKGINNTSKGWTIGGRDLSTSTAGVSGPASKIPVARPTPGKQSAMGGQIASGVKNALGLGQSAIQAAAPALTPPATAQLGGGIRGAVEAALASARTPVQRPAPGPATPAPTAAPVTPTTSVAQPPANGNGQNLPLAPTPQRLPGSAVSGLGADGKPVPIPPSTITPGTNVQGETVTLNPPPTAPGTTPTTPGGLGATPGTAPDGTAAPTAPAGSIGSPQGQIPMELNIAYGRGGDWATVNQYDAAFVEAGSKYGVDPSMLKAMMVVESGGQNIPNGNGFPNSGPMQLTSVQFGAGEYTKWDRVADELGLDITNPEHQVQIAAYVLGGHDGDQGTPEEIFLSTYYPTECLDCPGGDGHTPRQYLEDIATLQGIINGAAGTTPTAPAGTHIDPATGQPVMVGTTNDPNQPVLVGNADAAPVDPTQARPPVASGSIAPMATPAGEMTGQAQGYPVAQGDGLGIYAGPDADETWIQDMFPGGEGGVSTDYKQDVCTYNPDCCNGGPDCWYNSNLMMAGASNTVHPGYDVSAPAGTAFHAPMGGEVLGTKYNAGDPRCITPDGLNHCSWAADDGIVMDGGVDTQGNQIYINYDHSIPDASLVGQYVDAGTPLGTVSQENHIHVEIHGWCPSLGKSVVLDPSLVYGGYYQTHSVCEGVA